MRLPRRPRLLIPVAIALVAIVILFFVFAGVFTDWLWFDSVGYTSVFSTMLVTQLLLFVFGALLMGVVVGGNMIIAYRSRPLFAMTMFERGTSGADRYRAAIDPHRRAIFLLGLAVLGLFTGSSTAAQWKTWLLFVNATPFGKNDPQFGLDISFFMFTYPFIRMVLNFLFTAVIISIVLAAIVHYLYGGFRLQSPGLHATRAARVHLSVLVGLFVLLKAVAYWVDRFGLVFSDRGKTFGASYTDIHAVLPAKSILAIIALICAALFFAGVVRPGGMLPGVGLGLLVLSAVLVGGVYPALVEQFQVKPNQQSKEQEYIGKNIAATREAYGVASAKVTPYGAKTQAQGNQQSLQSEASTIPGVRLLDPTVVSPTYEQLQQIKGYYQFPEQLDVDRYTIDGVSRDTVVAVREIGTPPERNWINDHLVYTHGFGFVASPGSKIDQGKPDFVVKDIPPTNGLGDFEPRIYFGEHSPEYSIVGGHKELDYPEQSNNGQGSGQVDTTYAGKGGVSIGNFFNRLLYAGKYGETNLLLSSAINDQSRILYNRDPRQRVQQVAPFLTLDGDPYPAIVNKRVQWIVDGYTMSEDYPYAERRSFGDMTRDTSTDKLLAPQQQQPRDQINYIRNSVKATVDAYDGTVTLYAWDDKDPLLRTWEKAFGGIIQPKSKIPTELKNHLRYPEDLFKVQRDILSQYHVTDANAFYGAQDFWKVPEDPASTKTKQPPYYVTLKMPGDQQPRFSLTTTLVPTSRDNLAAFMAVDAAGEADAQISILQLPSDTTIPGPKQAQNTFDTKAASVLNELRIGGTTETLNGNLLTLPFGGGLLYVEPVYVQPKVQNSARYPTLARVLVMFGNDVGIGNTLQDALEQVFGQVGQQPTTPNVPTQPNTPGTSTELTQAYANAQKAYDDGQKAIKSGDFAAYGEAQKRLEQALKDLQSALGQQKAAPSPTATPAPSSASALTATPTPTPPPSSTPSSKS
ncbi:UPF0182 family membrane protein [Sphaerisporangium fuscum]|uniref:UPF0182 family membrane protein n=1 Tax=Sphaerisporangium fuscum TaxID=2835868 RepID=UPI001BDD7628|nr:UPF0182 family protein [Sphaerisporangium fuscum]